MGRCHSLSQQRGCCRTLKDIKKNATAGSILIADIYSNRFTSGDYSPLIKFINPFLKLTKEEFDFGLHFSDRPRENLSAFLEDSTLQLGDAQFMGINNKKKEAYAVVLEAFC